MVTLYNPETGADIGVTDANGVGQLILSDRVAYVHLKGKSIQYEDHIANELLALYSFLVDVNKGNEDIHYEEIELEGKKYYFDPSSRKVIPKEERDKEKVKEILELQEVAKDAVPAIPKEAMKVKVDKMLIARHNTDNVIKSFQDPASNYEGSGLTAD